MQVRQLQTLGFPIKRDILAEVDTAGRFYRHGLVLKQVANFYNDIATQIIPCQKPMLLAVSCHDVCVVFHCSCIMSASDLSTQAACMRLVSSRELQLLPGGQQHIHASPWAPAGCTGL